MTTTRSSASLTLRTLAAIVCLSTVAGCGEGAKTVSNACPGIASTGGDPVAGGVKNSMGLLSTTWIVTDSCQVPYAKTATPDWCSQLVFGNGNVKDGLFLGQAFAPIRTDSGRDAKGVFKAASWVQYTEDLGCPMHDCGTYAARVIYAGQTTTNFPPGCLQQNTPEPSCGELQT